MATATPAEADGICGPAEFHHAKVTEQAVSIDTPDGRISGTLAMPQDQASRALVLMLQGYTGSRNETRVARGRGMFAHTAELFARRGIASLRIDFIGSGRSDGAWADTRFSGQARDAIRAARWLRNHHEDKTLPLGVLGYSQGGLVALRAGASGGPFDRLALWNPVMDPMATYGIIFGRDRIVEAARLFKPDRPGEIVERTRLRPGFFAELVRADPVADAARVPAPVLIVTGQRDPLVKNGAALADRLRTVREDAGQPSTTIIDRDMGHDLGAIREPEILSEMISCTAGFLLGAPAR